MNTLKEIGRALENAAKILVFPHVNMDGDCLGSSVALVRALREKGKEAWVLTEDKTADFLAFLDRGYCTGDPDLIGDPDISVAMDCYGEDRMPRRWRKFLSGRTLVTIDHHATEKDYQGLFYVDPQASATGEIVYDLLTEMGAEIDAETAGALFAAITTDTGNYQYTNCNARAHEITAELYRRGLDANRVSNEIYGNVPLCKIRLEAAALENMELVCGGRGAIVYVTQEMLRETGALMEHSEGIVARVRNIAGVELAALVKENEEDEIRVSLRAKGEGDVAAIGEKFGGGGHTKAAGCTLYTDIQEAVKEIRESFTEVLQ